MKALQTDFFGDHNIGLFGKCSDSLCVLGGTVQSKKAAKMKSVLGVDVLQTNIANSELVGIFSALNSNGMVLTKISADHEVKSIASDLKKKGMNVCVLNSNFTAVGNLILCNDKGAMVSNLISSKEKKSVEDCLGVDCDYGSVAGLNSIGSCGLVNNNGCVIHRDASEEELNHFQDVLKVNTDVSTANFGSPFLGACGMSNGNGIVIGQSTTGPEITRIMETLGLL